MKISGSNPVRPSTAAQRKKGAGSGSSSAQAADDFLSVLGGGAQPVSTSQQPVSDIQPISTVSALLTLQEMPEDEVNNRKAIVHSKTILETLEQLRHSLLMGSLPAHVLKDLNRLVNSHRHLAVDPKLKEILDDIDLRAAVELAKLEKATD